jgi:hypothetical protein
MTKEFQVLKTRKDALNAMLTEWGIKRSDPEDQYITREEAVQALQAIVKLKGGNSD